MLEQAPRLDGIASTGQALGCTCKRPAGPPSRLILRWAWRESSAPRSFDTWPAVNPTAARRGERAAYENVSWIHSVIKGLFPGIATSLRVLLQKLQCLVIEFIDM